MGVGVQGEAGGEVALHAGDPLSENPAQAQRSGLRRERRSHGMSEPCLLRDGARDMESATTRWSMCSTLSGEMGPPLGDGNTHGLPPAFFLLL